MLAYVATAVVPVGDAERALNFYVNLLDFERRGETTARDSGRRIAIAPRRGRGMLTLASGQRARQRRDGERFAGSSSARPTSGPPIASFARAASPSSRLRTPSPRGCCRRVSSMRMGMACS